MSEPASYRPEASPPRSARRTPRRWAGSRESRERFLQTARAFVPYLVTERDGQLLIVSTDDSTQGKLFTRRKRKEQRALERGLDLLASRGVRVDRGTFVDVGANVGTTTLAALEAGFSKVIACEPMRSSFRILRANLALNGVDDSVVPLELALSNRAGNATLDAAGGSRKARVLARANDRPRGRSQEVRLARLDDLVGDGVLDPDQVDLLFMDVEGHECHVLEGGAGLLRAEIPLIMELNPKLLRLAGKIDAPGALLGRYYTHILDLRGKGDRTFVPVDRLDGLMHRLNGKATDILACRLPSA